MKSHVVDEFEYKGHKCVIVKMVLRSEEYHNGYIKMADSEEQVETVKANEKDIDTTYDRFFREGNSDELTFSGEVKDVDGYYFGFDSAHLWNDKKPYTKQKNSVKKRTKKMVEEFEEKNIFERVKSEGENNG